MFREGFRWVLDAVRALRPAQTPPTAMPHGWYELVRAETPLTQGDLIEDCPVLTWDRTGLKLGGDPGAEDLRALVRAQRADVVVMTQACDLEHGKVRDVILCPHFALSEYYDVWKSARSQDGQNPTTKAWQKHRASVRDGFEWHLALLNAGEAGDQKTDHRVVEFHIVHTLPREFIESLQMQRGRPRLRLLPPYREHLSQAFARFFMRVGLPSPIDETW